MNDKAATWLPDAVSTASAGRSFAHTLYHRPVTILLRGALGAGKTTFLQGFGIGLGIVDLLRSPTHALEQRYPLPSGDELLHVDLYRLSSNDADALVAGSDDFRGVRCIEWADRLVSSPMDSIDILLTDTWAEYPLTKKMSREQAFGLRSGRYLEITFRDMTFPPVSSIDEWRDLVALPSHIRTHCDTVAAYARTLGDVLLQRGIIVRPKALEYSAQLHDLFRFFDFRPGAQPVGVMTSAEEDATHACWKERYPALKHEAACAQFLREQGCPELAEIVAVHGFHHEPAELHTTEQKLLFYADKRVMGDRIVTIQERFDDFRKRYGAGMESATAKQWRAEVEAVERELFPDGSPL